MIFINRERIVCTVSHCKSVTKYLEYLNINVEKYIKYWSRADYVTAHEGLCQRRWSHRQAYFTACSVQTLHVTSSFTLAVFSFGEQSHVFGPVMYCGVDSIYISQWLYFNAGQWMT